MGPRFVGHQWHPHERTNHADRSQQNRCSSAVVLLDRGRRTLGVAHRRLRVGQREQHLGQRDAVADAVVHPHDQGACAVRVADEVHQPRRLAQVERAAHQVGDEGVEVHIERAGQGRRTDVGVDVEAGVVPPDGTRPRATGAHRATAKGRVPVGDALLDKGAQHLLVR